VITGLVNARYEAMIRALVRDAAGQAHEIEAIIDTGFNGSLTLPPALIAALALPWRTRGSAILANGTEDEFDIYAATLIWDGIPRPILIESVDTAPLVGMALLYGYDVRIQAIDGGLMTLEALPKMDQSRPA